MSNYQTMKGDIFSFVKEHIAPKTWDDNQIQDWVDRFVVQPIQYLGGKTPSEVCETVEGRQQVMQVLANIVGWVYL